MKTIKVTITTILLTIFISSCYTLKEATIEKPFVQVCDSLEQTQNDLFLKANDWMVSTFNDAESVIEYSDKEEGVLIGKYLMSGGVRVSTGLYGSSSTDTRIFAKINIRVKDNKARITIDPGTWKYYSGVDDKYSYTKEKAGVDMRRLSKSFFEHLKTSDIDF